MKQKQDREYRARKRAKAAAERREARIAAGLPPDSPERPKKPEKKPEKKVKTEKPPTKPPPPHKPPPEPPLHKPLAAVRCEVASCGKWRRVPRTVLRELTPHARWVCAFNAHAPLETRKCEWPSEWTTDDERLAWLGEQDAAERDARAAGAKVEGDPEPEPEPEPTTGDDSKWDYWRHPGGGGGGGGGGRCPACKKSKSGKCGTSTAVKNCHNRVPGSGKNGKSAAAPAEETTIVRVDAGIRDDLPRGTVSGYAAEAMTAEEEDEHDDPGRPPNAPRTPPPHRPRGKAFAAVPVVCGGIPGVFLPRRAMFRCMCTEEHENCVSRSGVDDGVVMTTTAFEKHCGMEKSKNWRNSVTVLCEGDRVKVGNWLDEVGIDVARGKGGGGKWGAGNGPGGGAKKDKADGKAATKRERRGDFRWQPKRPGPFAQLPLRQIMRVLEIVLDARFESQSRGGDAAPSADVEGADVSNQKHASTSEEGRRELARAACVSKAFHCAASTVALTRGVADWRPEVERKPEAEERDQAAADAMELDGVETATRPVKVEIDAGSAGGEGVGVRLTLAAAEGDARLPSADGVAAMETDSTEERLAEEKRAARRERDRERRRGDKKFSKTDADYTATRAQLNIIEDYVHRGDPDEVTKERTVTLAPDQPRFESCGGDAAGADVEGDAANRRHVSEKHPGEDAIDRRVKVFWPEENAFFSGVVTGFDKKSGNHTVCYDDGDVEEINLSKETMEWLEPGGDRVAGGKITVAANGEVSDPNRPPGWWPVLGEWPKVDGEQRRHKKLGEEVTEQETYGVDYVTARDVVGVFKEVLPEYNDDDLWRLSDDLMMRVNASYGPMSPDAPATQSLAMASEDLATVLERSTGGRYSDEEGKDNVARAKALWKLARYARQSPEMFAVHRKGFGVVCSPGSAGVKAGDLVVDFLGEMYPPWAWQAKQDAIKTAQKNRGMREAGPPEFYNMQLERPPGDAEGFSILFVDAMHYNNYAARLSHSCDPNVEVSLKAIEGMYRINFYAKRDVKPGEELCYNYHSCTDSMKEVEAAFCLCAARRCRASYLAFVGEQSNGHALARCHRVIERHAALLVAGDAVGPPAPSATRAMEEVGLRCGRGLLRDAPNWLLHYVAWAASFMREELRALPRDILNEQRESAAKQAAKDGPNSKWQPPPFGLGDAEIEALAVREIRQQAMAICLSKVRYLLGRGPEKARIADAPPPMKPLTEAEAARRIFGAARVDGAPSLLSSLIALMAPHARHGEDAVAHARFVSEAEQIAEDVCGYDGECDDVAAALLAANAADAADAADDDDEFDDDDSRRSPAKPRSPRAPTKSLREGLFWLRDRLAAMPPTRGARHDIAAELVHFHAHCSRYWVVSTSSHHQALRADPIEVRENEVHSYGVGAEGASDRVVSRIEKTYKPGTAAGSLLTWYKQDQARSIHWSPYDRVRVVNADP